MDILLKQTDFVDSRHSVDYGLNKRATFISVDETFYGNNNLGRVFRINIQIETFDNAGNKIDGTFATSVIGIGDMQAGIFPIDPTNVILLGQLLSWDNVEQCVIRLYE